VDSKDKSMLIIFFDIKDIVHKDFALAGQTVNSAYYCVNICEEFFAPNFGDKINCRDKTTHRLTPPFPPGNILPKTK
jgi:hypothetical protein